MEQVVLEPWDPGGRCSPELISGIQTPIIPDTVNSDGTGVGINKQTDGMLQQITLVMGETNYRSENSEEAEIQNLMKLLSM